MSGFLASIPTPPRVLSDDEQDRLLKITGNHVKGHRDHMIISMGLGTGLREHELAALKVGDILTDAGHIKTVVWLSKYKKTRGTPPTQRIVLNETLRTKLKKFVHWKRDQDESTTPDAPLFMSRKHNALSTKAMRTMFRTWQKRAGFETFYTFHSLRHSAITSVYQKEKDIRAAMAFGRLKAMSMAQRYTHPTLEDLVRQVQGIRC